MKPALALLDWDGTLRPGFTIVDWTEFLVERAVVSPGVGASIRRLVAGYQAGGVGYEQLATQSGEALALGLGGVAVDSLRRLAAVFARKDAARLRPFTIALLELLERHRARVVVISGAPEEPLLAHGKRLGLSVLRGLRLEAKAGLYTGRVAENPGTSVAKQALIDELVGGDTVPVLLAMGDTVSDLPLLAVADVRVVMGDEPGLDMDSSFLHVTGELGDIERIETALNGLAR